MACVISCPCGAQLRLAGPKRKPPAKIPTIPEQAAIDSRLINWVRWLRTPEDTGLGDTVERLLAKAGGRKIKKMLERIGVGCGCTDRQAALNRKYPYQGSENGNTKDTGKANG